MLAPASRKDGAVRSTMTNSTRFLLLALIGGIGTGLLVRFLGNPAFAALALSVKPIGVLWLAALKMTLVPLVFGLVASAVVTLLNSQAGGRAIATTIAVFVAMLAFATATGMAAITLLLKLWPTPPGVLAGLLHDNAATTAAAPPGAGGLMAQLVSLVPENPVAAAAQGQIAPLVIFALAFGWAISGLPSDQRTTLATIMKAIAEAMMAIVRVVLMAAPAGVFVLALDAALEAGAGLAALLAQGVVMLVIVMSGAILVCHGIARLAGGVPWRRFARAAAAPQAVAAGTCSSLATLPSMLAAADDGLGIDPALAGATIPLAVSTFRFGTALSVTFSSLFAAHAAGIHLGPSQYLVAGLLVILTNAGVAGLPAAAVLYAADAPIFQAIGAPLAFIPLWIAVFAIPDMFITVCNVTADLSAVTVIRRILERRSGQPLAQVTVA